MKLLKIVKSLDGPADDLSWRSWQTRTLDVWQTTIASIDYSSICNQQEKCTIRDPIRDRRKSLAIFAHSPQTKSSCFEVISESLLYCLKIPKIVEKLFGNRLSTGHNQQITNRLDLVDRLSGEELLFDSSLQSIGDPIAVNSCELACFR